MDTVKNRNKYLRIGLITASVFVLIIAIVIGQTIQKRSFEFSGAQGQQNNIFYLSNDQGKIPAVDEVATATLYMDSTAVIVGVDAVLTYNPEDIKVHKITKRDDSPFVSYPQSEVDQSIGKIYFSANLGTDLGRQGVRGKAIPLANIEFILITSSPTSISFDYQKGNRNDSNMVSIQNGVEDVLEGAKGLDFNAAQTQLNATVTKSSKQNALQRMFAWLFRRK